MSRQQFSMFAIAVVVILLIVPFGRVVVWNGRFPLTIVIDADQPIDAGELCFATCWRESEAEYTVKAGPTGEALFRPGVCKSDSHYTISVPCSGRSGPYGINYSYHEPLFLVIQYSILKGDENYIRRKLFSIPTGCGPRSLNVTVP